MQSVYIYYYYLNQKIKAIIMINILMDNKVYLTKLWLLEL